MQITEPVFVGIAFFRNGQIKIVGSKGHETYKEAYEACKKYVKQDHSLKSICIQSLQYAEEDL